MNDQSRENHIIENYQNDEKMMILIYAQWCINNDLDPEALYKAAYPHQPNNNALTEALELTIPRKESDPISNETVIGALQLFGNDDLAFTVQQKIDQLNSEKRSHLK
ncbi:uncharacterized protein JNUCC1_02295 [Lentibacillus sp. JNUCC-1]|uniref:hypothetical protein n=1 Tax=Lentibacillus sp. JNUCC-1 TaxID=2654513 RepID=UPI0012E98AB1|nr:hypothetical protein [Lentibacillus sp. JNUCC-1]MUV38457.1 uncharacterized protein [Lentibacillus sp. JNUCC-1]